MSEPGVVPPHVAELLHEPEDVAVKMAALTMHGIKSCTVTAQTFKIVVFKYPIVFMISVF